MKKEVKKKPKVALCRLCHGTGRVVVAGLSGVREDACPQCEGSGRVTVSCEMTLDIRPYKEEKEQTED